MALRIKDTGSVPTELWQFPIAQTGVTIWAPNWPALYSAIEAHCAPNGISPPSLQEVVNWCCHNLSISCYDDASKMPLVNKLTSALPVVLPGCCGGRKK